MAGTWLAARAFEDEECMDIFEEDMRWLYLAESGEWHMFDENPSEKCTVTNREIERNYCRNWDGLMEYSMDNCIYILDFSEMKLTNLDTGKEQPVKRQSTPGHSSLHSKPTHPVPSHWEKDLPFQVK
uniref:WWE domain-containing protein n=1 Tax=Anguilla anguilla TaxID=7936 RepID=A0A0E9XBF3_ANGAN